MKFVPEDFLDSSLNEAANEVMRHLTLDVGLLNKQFRKLTVICAARANARLQEMLKEAPVVECDHPGNLEDCAWLAPGILLRPVHTARLVDIKPIKASKK